MIENAAVLGPFNPVTARRFLNSSGQSRLLASKNANGLSLLARLPINSFLRIVFFARAA
jgi:hypothetical protein